MLESEIRTEVSPSTVYAPIYKLLVQTEYLAGNNDLFGVISTFQGLLVGKYYRVCKNTRDIFIRNEALSSKTSNTTNNTFLDKNSLS